MDRVVPLIVTFLLGMVTFVFLVLGLLNGIGAISAHADAVRMNAARDCGLQNADSNCISYRSAVVHDRSFGSLVLDFGNGEVLEVDTASRTRLANSASGP